MRKIDELDLKHSCLNKAHDDELVFVLLARDICAPTAIRYWCAVRLYEGKNHYHDPQIQEAYKLAEKMEKQRKDFLITGEFK